MISRISRHLINVKPKELWQIEKVNRESREWLLACPPRSAQRIVSRSRRNPRTPSKVVANARTIMNGVWNKRAPGLGDRQHDARIDMLPWHFGKDTAIRFK
jgi:hypothetical protein